MTMRSLPYVGALFVLTAFAAGCGGTPFKGDGLDDASVGSDAGGLDAATSADGNAADAATDGPIEGAPGAESFACGTVNCDMTSQYCYTKGTGPNRQYECRTIPDSCRNTLTCSCIQKQDPQCNFPQCTKDSGGGITVACGL